MNTRVEIHQRLHQNLAEPANVRFITFRAPGTATELRLDWSEWQRMGAPANVDVSIVETPQ